MSILHRKLVRDLMKMKGNAIAIALVIACGVAAFVAMRAMYRSLLISQTDYYSRYRFANVFVELKRAPKYLQDQLQNIPGVNAVETRVVMDVTMDVPGLEDPAVARLISLPTPRVPLLNNLVLRAGRYAFPGNDEEVVASEAFAKANRLSLSSEVHAVINGRWKTLRIVGIAISPEYIYEIRGGASIFPDNRRFGVLWMAEDSLAPALHMDGAFNSAALSLSPEASEAEVISRVDRLLDPYGSLGAYGRADQLSHRFISDEISQNRISADVIPGIFLGVAALLVHLVLTRLVGTQRADVAVIKAFGYSNLAVGVHYVEFSLIVVGAGYLLGCATGWYFGIKLAALYAEFYRFPFLVYRPEPQIFIWAAVISVITAIGGAIGAVWRAVSLPPAEAMRPESPARFRPMLVDRLRLPIFSPATRMIIRNLERRPWKAIGSAFAICCSVMIVVVEFGLFDAMNRMMQIQFRDVQREDLAVMLNEVHSPRTRFALEKMTGVISSEPFRMVPVRLRYQHRSRKTAVLGLPNPSELRLIMDEHGRRTRLPPEGMVLTTTLAELLGVTTGESIAVEVLDGERRIRQVILTGTVDELLGTAAYMDLDALNRLLGEDRAISGAWLQVDSARQGQLYRELKQLPAVAGVSIKAAALTSFEETISRSMTLSIGTLIVFASIIAIGMIYNGARIALSERANELSTLRILGFTRGEITFMLLGEQAIITTIAVPFGFGVGYALCAILSARLQTELYRMPLVVNASSYAWAFIIILAAALVSAALVGRRVASLDIISVLKSRE